MPNKNNSVARRIISHGNNAAVAGVIIFITLTTATISLNPQYKITQFLSELGISSYGFLFNSGAIISGLLFILFFLNLKNYFKNSLFIRTTILLATISSLSLTGVGIFTLLYPLLHLIFATIFFILTGLSILLVSVKLHPKNRILSYIGLTVVFIDILLAVFPNGVTQKIAVSGFLIWILTVSIKM